ALDRHDLVVATPDHKRGHADFGEHGRQGGIVHIWSKAHAHRHAATGFALATEFDDRRRAVNALIFGRAARVVKAPLDYFAPRVHEDVENLGGLGLNPGRVHEPETAQRRGTPDRHIGGNPAAEADTDQIDRATLGFLQKPEIEQGLVLNGRNPLRAVRLSITWM